MARNVPFLMSFEGWRGMREIFEPDMMRV